MRHLVFIIWVFIIFHQYVSTMVSIRIPSKNNCWPHSFLKYPKVPKVKIDILKNLLIFDKKYLSQSVRMLEEGRGVEMLFGEISFEHAVSFLGVSLLTRSTPRTLSLLKFEWKTLTSETCQLSLSVEVLIAVINTVPWASQVSTQPSSSQFDMVPGGRTGHRRRQRFFSYHHHHQSLGQV